MNKEKWREQLKTIPTIIEGNAEIWDDGCEQQGIYFQLNENEEYTPLSEILMRGLVKKEYISIIPLGRVRVTITFETLPEEDNSL